MKYEDVPNGAWAALDGLLFEGFRIAAIKAMCDESGASLPEAIQFVHQRWQTLSESSPASFEVTLDGYWDGVYT